MAYARITSAIYAHIWAVQPEYLDSIAAFIEMKAAGGFADVDLVAGFAEKNELQAARRSAASSAGNGAVAVLPLYGLIMQRGDMLGGLSSARGTSIQQFTQQFRQALNDPAIKAIVIDVDSPGGTVSGCEELAAEILASRGKKPIIAVANCQMASAAFYIAAGADEIVASPSALVGSIGVYAALRDESEALQQAGIKHTLVTYGENKAEGDPRVPVTAKAIGHLQQLVDAAGTMFDNHVAKARGVTAGAVRSAYGQGRMFDAAQAKQIGLVDRVESFDQTLARLGVNPSAPARQMMQSSSVPGISAAAADDGAATCQCPCDPCVAGNCEDCSMDDCGFDGCGCEASQARQKAAAERVLQSAAVRRRALIAAV